MGWIWIGTYKLRVDMTRTSSATNNARQKQPSPRDEKKGEWGGGRNGLRGTRTYKGALGSHSQ
ncbi:hypothetical protein Ancab_025085, partial [Ancistrocladus abbreviatus]